MTKEEIHELNGLAFLALVVAPIGFGGVLYILVKLNEAYNGSVRLSDVCAQERVARLEAVRNNSRPTIGMYTPSVQAFFADKVPGRAKPQRRTVGPHHLRV